MSAFRQSVKQMLAETLLLCPRCAAQDIPNAKPTLEREQNGTFTCTTCGHNFAPPKET